MAAWHGNMLVLVIKVSNWLQASANLCWHIELCGLAAAERAEYHQQQAHWDLAKLLEQPGADTLSPAFQPICSEQIKTLSDHHCLVIMHSNLMQISGC